MKKPFILLLFFLWSSYKCHADPSDPLGAALQRLHCQNQKAACIGSAVCVGVCGVGTLFFLNIPCAAALGVCSDILNATKNFCSSSCAGSSDSQDSYCTLPGFTSPLTDPKHASACCQHSAPANPLPINCPSPLSSDPSITQRIASAMGASNASAGNMKALDSNAAIVPVQAPSPSQTPTLSSSEMLPIQSTAITANSTPTATPTIITPLRPLSQNLSNGQTANESPYSSNTSLPKGSTPTASPTPQEVSLTENPNLSGAANRNKDSNTSPKKSPQKNPTNANTLLDSDKNESSQSDSESSSEETLKGEDSEEYFTKNNLNESLFKIVHLRYEAKMRSWLVPEKKQKYHEK